VKNPAFCAPKSHELNACSGCHFAVILRLATQLAKVMCPFLFWLGEPLHA
jgi:hypothetical protein